MRGDGAGAIGYSGGEDTQRDGTARHGTAQHSTAQHSTAQHSTAQAQHGTARISLVPCTNHIHASWSLLTTQEEEEEANSTIG